MKTYTFTIVLKEADLTEAQANAIFEAGGTDATPGVLCGRAFVDFDRRAASLAQAISSAVRQVRRAGLKPDHLEPEDLVSASEIAERSGSTRQSISNYVQGKRCVGRFPAPVARVKTSSPLWRWTEVAEFLAASRHINKTVVREAHILVRLNQQLRRKVVRVRGRKSTAKVHC